MPIDELIQHNDPSNAKLWVALDRAVHRARRNLRIRKTVLAAGFTLPLAVAAVLGWVAASRFTLLEPPQWPPLVLLGVWFTAIVLWGTTRDVPTSRCAHVIDESNALDERVATLVELRGSGFWAGPSNPGIANLLLRDTASALGENRYKLPPAFTPRVPLWQASLSVLLALGLAWVMNAPSPLDAVKAERALVRKTLADQTKRLEELRLELVARPGLDAAAKERLSGQLESLETELKNIPLERAEALAAVARAEQKIRELIPTPPSEEFASILNAGKLVQAGALAGTDWDPDLSPAATDLGKSADAASHIDTYKNQLTNVQARAIASNLERAAAVAAEKNPELAQNLQSAADAIRRRDLAKATEALQPAATTFKDADRQLQTAQAVESTLAKLSDGRDALAKAGATGQKKAQVGFRRPQVSPAQAVGSGPAQTTAEASPGAGQAQAGTGGPTGGSDRSLGNNRPAFNVPGANGSQGVPAQTGGQGGSGGTRNSAGGSSEAQAGAGTSSGGGTGSPSGGGTVQGQVSGPIRGGGGQGVGGGLAQGNGTGGSSAAASSTGDQQQNTQGAERVYVPGQAGGGSVTASRGQSAADSQRTGDVEGRVGSGSGGDGARPAQPSAGSLTQIRTPYTQVIGEYSKQATEALERAYVPPDAKSYVRDYFAGLGK